MSSGESSGPVHPVPTDRSGYQYFFYVKHHGQGGPGAAQWLPTLRDDEEFAIFNTADQHDFSDDRGWYFGVLPADSSAIRQIGTWGQQLAEFPHARPNEPWHGYPLWPLGEIGPPNRGGERQRPQTECIFEDGERGTSDDAGSKAVVQGGPCMKTPTETSQNGLTKFKVMRDFGFDISWAGAIPWAPGLCLGTEDGKVAFVRNDDTQPPVFWPVSDAGEAINGIAFVDSLMAVSTRSEVTFLTQGKAVEKAVSPRGSHGVIATPNGRILAPLGAAGLMCMIAKERTTRPISVLMGNDEQYLYKIAALPTQSDSDVIVAAARRGGLVTLVLKPEHGSIGSSRQLPNMDVVDVCPIGRNYPLGAIALGIDGSIYAIENVLQKRQLKTLKFDTIQGRAYRALCSGDHLFVLTSERLYAFPKMLTRIMDGREGLCPTKARGFPLEAVDANLVEDEWLVIVMPDHVYLIEIRRLVEGEIGSIEDAPISRIGSLELETEEPSTWHSHPFDVGTCV